MVDELDSSLLDSWLEDVSCDGVNVDVRDELLESISSDS